MHILILGNHTQALYYNCLKQIDFLVVGLTVCVMGKLIATDAFEHDLAKVSPKYLIFCISLITLNFSNCLGFLQNL